MKALDLSRVALLPLALSLAFVSCGDEEGGTTVTEDNDTTGDGIADVDAGDADVDAGDADVDAGDADVDAGDADVDAGDADVDAGDADVDDSDADAAPECLAISPDGDIDFGMVYHGQTKLIHVSACNTCLEPIGLDLLAPIDFGGYAEPLIVQNLTIAGNPVDIADEMFLAELATERLSQGACIEGDFTFDAVNHSFPAFLNYHLSGGLSDGHMYSGTFSGVSVRQRVTTADECPTGTGLCYIEGVCYVTGARNPLDACLVCDGIQDAAGWTIASGFSCDDGDACTYDDVCDISGLCAGSPGTCPPSIATIDAGQEHNCVLTDGGAVYCWGRNNDGQCGLDNTTANIPTPTQSTGLASGIVDLSLGWAHTCAVDDEGGVLCWGNNNDGRLGDGSTTQSQVPVAVSGIDSAVAISAGDRHSCAVLDTGTVECWGDNEYGQLGDSTNTDSLVPVEVTGLTGVVDVAAGRFFTCALLDTDGVTCWGDNEYGSLGDGTNTNSNEPVDVLNLTGALSIEAGLYHTCVMDALGAQCWGWNHYGQLGDGSNEWSNTPVRVQTGEDFVSIDLRGEHTCAVRTSGEVVCFGSNSYSRVGIDLVDYNAWYPAWVDTAPHEGRLAATGRYHSCAVMTDDTVFCWGAGSRGQLGRVFDGTSSSPMEVIW